MKASGVGGVVLVGTEHNRPVTKAGWALKYYVGGVNLVVDGSVAGGGKHRAWVRHYRKHMRKVEV